MSGAVKYINTQAIKHSDIQKLPLLLQDEFLRGGALWRGEGDEVGAGGEVTEGEGGV